jgi:CheY-like chemotaxis protein
MTAHNGHIWVRSSGVPGEGCVFGMELDISEFLPDKESVCVQPVPKAKDEPQRSNSTHILIGAETIELPVYSTVEALVVDDTVSNRKMLMRHLKHYGVAHMTQACNGLEAVQAVERRMRGADFDANGDDSDKMFDIIFMDCNMPVMGGNEATTKIRELGYKGAIVIVTGDGLPEDFKKAEESGASRVLLKPIDMEDISNCLQGKYIILYFPHVNMYVMN